MGARTCTVTPTHTHRRAGFLHTHVHERASPVEGGGMRERGDERERGAGKREEEGEPHFV